MPVQSYSLKVQPGTHFINWQQDPFANYLARVVFPEKARQLVIDVELIVDMTVINPFDFFLDENVENFPFKYTSQLKKDLAPYLQITEKGPLLSAWMTQVERGRKPIVDFLVGINQQVQQSTGYLVRFEAGVQSCEETLQLRSGSCRDTAWLLVQVLRHLGLAARFVSGYLIQLKPDLKPVDGPTGPEQDFTDLHAWAEVYIPGAGWLGLDPTSGLFAGEGHIPLACTPQPQSAAPVTGATGICEVQFEYSNSVVRIHEDPRVTKPYSALQWQNMDKLGEAVDRQLDKHKVMLTMGGEPTFVSIDDMESPQWITAALGADKLRLAGELLRELQQEFGSDGYVHHGQGKWYPGEPLPRWALGIFWRSDGKPLWQDKQWLGNPATSGTSKPADAKAFMLALCEELGLDRRFVLPAYEDADWYLRREGQLPKNVTVSRNKLSDPLERERLRRIFDQGLASIAGHVLPLGWAGSERKGHWSSSRWQFRRKRLYLLPGDSALGLRLPLASLPWEMERDYNFEKDPFRDLQSLQPAQHTTEPDTARSSDSKGKRTRPRFVEKIIHTALCVEVRDSHLYVFMPPLQAAEVYLSLLASVERCAARLQLPVILEGYEAPRDPRLRKLMITPDPGVIEVNIHPASSWKELVHITRTLYDSARQCRLGTEKFMLDGKHTGTGGGNHVTLGGPRAEDSPFLRRPDLLGSLLRYWQNHPALSYLFSGQFIGPTSQAPRVDEARDDNLYELEIALQQLGAVGPGHPWLVDRVLRNFLVDLSGNTHRAEFCIDKLYSPDSPTGRLGLVEFRNFEMPPHWQMSAVQMLLLRTLVAWFWQQPYTKELIPWGNQLHDRFMLPHFVREDLDWVIHDLNAAGYAFETDWLLPFLEFRFPHLGRMHVAGLEVDVHGAIEPWHVLGEESSAQGTARYVDSSVERLQVRVRGMTGDRLILCCNDREIPLHSTGREGEFVGGIRYKAWSPWSALHPTIGVHTPLVLDVVDTHHMRSLGGCQYHVSHSGGRNYDTFPVNASEAEARRTQRFIQQGHLQGPRSVRREAPHPESPYTLDLRYRHKEHKR